MKYHQVKEGEWKTLCGLNGMEKTKLLLTKNIERQVVLAGGGRCNKCLKIAEGDKP